MCENRYRTTVKATTLLGIACFCFGCETTDRSDKSVRKKYGTLAPSGIEDTLATPPNQLSRKAYPFDSSGKYRQDWISDSSSSRTLEPRSSTATSTSLAAPTTSTNSATQRRYHLIKPGESLLSLGRIYDVSLNRLRKLNSLDSYTVRPGMVLRIPRF